MRDAVICEPLRTPVGGFGGMFRDVPAAELAATVIAELVRRTSLPAEQIDDVMLGQCYPNGEAPAIGRVAALDAGLPIEVPGPAARPPLRLGAAGDRARGCMQVQTGVADLVLAGGAESMSQAEFYATGMRWGVKGGGVELADRLARGRVTAGGARPPGPGGMIETAENLRRDYAIPREEQDELALRSHQRAVAAQAGRHVRRGDRAGDRHRPQGRARRSTATSTRAPTRRSSAWPRCAPIMARSDPEATVTAGNASGQNDGASVCIVTHPEKAAELGLRPLARLVSWAVAGVAPETMGIGPGAGDRARARSARGLRSPTWT